YESERNIADIPSSSSITYIIGPEGGFEDKEYEQICALGFESISLGKRILRAETAALYMTSVIVSKCQ
ncbi:MAG: RNA methyltransferase, partial [Erysipelotrichaceae bacterium]|nr:RNA methyltransferase [Erysipelotrichaceae bacterium]